MIRNRIEKLERAIQPKVSKLNRLTDEELFDNMAAILTGNKVNYKNFQIDEDFRHLSDEELDKRVQNCITTYKKEIDDATKRQSEKA